MALAASSYIPTAAAVLTRNRDQVTFPFPARPQPLTMYVRLIWLSGDTNTDLFILSVGSAAITTPRIVLDISGNSFRVLRQNDFVNPNRNQTVAVGGLAIGDTVELRGVMNSDGSVTLGVSRNGGAESVAGPSSPMAIPTAWAAQILMINSAGTAAVNFCAYRNILVVAGVQSLQTMRAWAGVA